MSPRQATVFDIQRFSIHDGPGIRTTVFFKGCNLRCAWCQNPEGMAPAPELAYYEDRCIDGCAACVAACPEGALRRRRGDRVDFARCNACGRCVAPCPGDALRVVGRAYDTDALLAAVLRDRSFYAASGGGVTLSGGEPLLQADFLRELLPRAKDAGLHVALETAGRFGLDRLEPLLPHLDLVLFDLKLVDTAAHARATGHGNGRILENLRALAARRAPLVEVRMPVVPGVNDHPDAVAAAARLLGELDVGSITLLRYNHLWEAKLPRLATPPAPLGIGPPEEAAHEAVVALFAAAGISTLP